jgi:Cu(I)/Ag(I) efflux system membrane fusion protein
MLNRESTGLPSAPQSAGRTELSWNAAGVLLVRFRFVFLVGVLLGLIAVWPFLRNSWDKFTRTPPPVGAVSTETEYWCPMCPGVVSDWPSKCPVCSMTLVRRQKGDMTPLPDGVVARVQLSPYRIQLAGIQTAPVEFRRLEHDISAGGLLEDESRSAVSSSLVLTTEVLERDAVQLSVGQEAELSCDACPGEVFTARIADVAPAGSAAAGRRIRLRVENPRGDLRLGTYASVRFTIPVSRLDTQRRAELDRWRDRSALGMSLAALGRLDGLPPVEGPLFALLDAAVRQAAAREGFVLTVPESAVIDTGSRKVVFVETMAGMFDAVEVQLGRREGDYYPVRTGLELGQRVATAGAILLDAETRLNPALAATYFGSGSRAQSGARQPPAGSTSAGSDDRQLIARQKVCPVTGADLDSMGGPKRLVVDGRVVFICCEHCEKTLRQKPAFYLAKLPR